MNKSYRKSLKFDPFREMSGTSITKKGVIMQIKTSELKSKIDNLKYFLELLEDEINDIEREGVDIIDFDESFNIVDVE